MDRFVLQQITQELRTTLSGMRITNLSHVDQNTVQLGFSGGLSAILSIDPNLPRLYQTTATLEATGKRTPFTSKLEHALLGATLTEISMQETDRIVEFLGERVNKIGVVHRFRLVFEIMGRMCNLLLVDPKEHQIIDCLKRSERGGRRQFPGEPYQFPSPPSGISIAGLERDQLQTELEQRPTQTIRSALMQAVQEFYPQLVDEILYQAQVDKARRVEALTVRQWSQVMEATMAFINRIHSGQFEPTIMVDAHDKLIALSAFPLHHVGEVARSFPTMNAAAETFYQTTQAQFMEAELRRQLQHIIEKNIQKLEGLKHQLEIDLKQAENAAEFRLKGELITANLHRLKPGLKTVRLPNYYEHPPVELEIELDPTISPQKNADRYFRKYRKARDGREIIAARRIEIKKSLQEWNQFRNELEQAIHLSDLQVLEAKLKRGGEIRPKDERRRRKSKKSLEEVIRPHQYTTSEGWTVLVGRNNTENDVLTLHIARKNDIWLHAQGVPGSHVVLRRDGRREISPKALEEAAAIAAFHSRAKHSEHVPVIYTERRYVRKPRGAAPGQVTCSQEKSIFVKPKRPTVGANRD
ncbi:MAG: fibronectin/fibrinogen-binding protein [Gemmatimonadetes bacterium]|nr:MAG: fibronectin/fibrinogen-binding protein [Gemmatimonadota bacterium]